MIPPSVAVRRAPVMVTSALLSAALVSAATREAAPLPPCPPPFDIALVGRYVTGELREGHGRIYRCNPDYGGAYLRYCNIPHWDSSLMVEAERVLWERAWLHVGPCQSSGGVDDGGGGDGAGTCSADDAACKANHVGGGAGNAEAQPLCPPPFEHDATYVAGELREDLGNAYQCNTEQGGAYARYCNVRDWDDSLLEEDARAREMWDRAWVFRGACRLRAWEDEVAVPDDAEGDAGHAEARPPCPPPFNGDTYVAGEFRAAGGQMYQCNVADGGAYEKYCNIHDWDDSLLEEDENAKEMLDGAWVIRGPCKPGSY